MSYDNLPTKRQRVSENGNAVVTKVKKFSTYYARTMIKT